MFARASTRITIYGFACGYAVRSPIKEDVKNKNKKPSIWMQEKKM